MGKHIAPYHSNVIRIVSLAFASLPTNLVIENVMINIRLGSRRRNVNWACGEPTCAQSRSWGLLRWLLGRVDYVHVLYYNAHIIIHTVNSPDPSLLPRFPYKSTSFHLTNPSSQTTSVCFSFFESIYVERFSHDSWSIIHVPWVRGSFHIRDNPDTLNLLF